MGIFLPLPPILQNQYYKVKAAKTKNIKKETFQPDIFVPFPNPHYICIVFHGIRFKVSEDWLS